MGYREVQDMAAGHWIHRQEVESKSEVGLVQVGVPPQAPVIYLLQLGPTSRPSFLELRSVQAP